MKICGIYTITNNVNKKVYVGKSVNIKSRWCDHRRKLIDGIHDNEYLQRSWNKYTEENFSFEVLETYPRSILISMEHYWCNLLQSHNRCYGFNIKPTSPDNENLCSSETRTKMSVSGKAGWNQERRDKASSQFKGRSNFWKKGKQSDELIRERIKLIKKPLNQFTLDNKHIKRWDSAKDVERELGYTSDYISQNCRGIIPKFRGFIWQYVDGDIKEK